MTNLTFQRPLEDYIAYLEHLTPRSVRLIEKLAAPEMRFIDPFNDARGVTDIAAVFSRMLGEAGRVKFQVRDIAWGRDGYTAYVRREMFCQGRQTDGISEIVFGPDGKIVLHHDHWDSGAQVMAQDWLGGRVWRMIRARFTA